MLQLLSPLALAALVSLAIPAVLHLWRPPARTVRIGTLKFFSGPAIRRLNKLRWRERLLLAVRLLLLTLLALLLAQPIWKRNPPTRAQRWALLEPGVDLRDDALKRWRELDSAGFQLRELADGFPRLTSLDARARETAGLSDIWSLLREMDVSLPPGSKVAVFSAGRFAQLRGERPAMRNCEIEWVQVSPRRDAERHKWIESLQILPRDRNAPAQLRASVGTSDAERTQRIRILVPAVAGRTPLAGALSGWSIEIRENAGRTFSARLLREAGEGDAEPWIDASELAPLRVAILHAADRAEDARYLKAALQSAAESGDRSASFAAEAVGADWIFWLNDEAPPPELLREVFERGANLLSDAEGSGTAAMKSSSELVTAPSEIFSGDALKGVDLFRRTAPADRPGTAIWTDQQGTPILTVAKEGRGHRWRFFSRFHPDWNQLPQNSALAAALRAIISAGNDSANHVAHDLRQLDPSQVRPAEMQSPASAPSFKISVPSEIVDLRKALWISCVLLFALERALSHRSRAINAAPVAAEQRAPERVLVGNA